MKESALASFAALGAFLVRGVQAAVADELHDRAREELDVLQDDAQKEAAAGATPGSVDVDAVVADLAVGNIVSG